jgi:hypothetical protein
MKRSRTQHDETESIDRVLDSAWRSGGSRVMMSGEATPMTSIQASSVGDLTCQALHLALSALQIDIAWHAGMASAEEAMERLHHEVGETVKRHSESTRAGSPEPAGRLPSPETPMRQGASPS